MFSNFAYFIKPLKTHLFCSLDKNNDLPRFISGGRDLAGRAHWRQTACVTQSFGQ